MPTDARNKRIRTCKKCGAPITSEICPYCGGFTGIATENADVEYPEVECKEASLDFWGTAFPAIFAVSFSGMSIWMPFFFWVSGELEPIIFPLLAPFAIVGIVATFIVLRNIWFFLSVRLFGIELDGVVYGYMNDTVTYNDMPGQVCKILVYTSNGPRYIMYQLHGTTRPYPVNKKLTVRVYKDRFAIVNKQRYEAWE